MNSRPSIAALILLFALATGCISKDFPTHEGNSLDGDAGDATTTDTTDATDASDVLDSSDTADATDVADVADATDTTDTSDAHDTGDDADAGGPIGCSDESDCLAQSDAVGVCNAQQICEYECADGFVDLTGTTDDGCELSVDQAVFVAAGAADDADGLSPENPMGDIEAALSTAADKNRPYVLAAAGTYNQRVSLQEGVHLYGGYDSEWNRDIDENVTIIAPGAEAFPEGTTNYDTIVADSGSGLTTIIDGLTIVGADAETLGASTYAVRAVAFDGLVVRNSTLKGGNGANGTTGASGQTAECTPEDGGRGGSVGSNEKPCYGADGDAQAGEPGKPDPRGGDGGDGGAHLCRESTGDCTTAVNGQNGQPGAPRDDGDHGTQADSNRGSVQGDYWSAPTGEPPTNGSIGAGGGGGGAGGNCQGDNSLCIGESACLDTGGLGGRGGTGGCHGTAGQNGGTGGGSFVILAVNSEFSVEHTRIDIGRGGKGGDGGNGGDGQPGEDGTDGTGGSGNAGNGGNGGDGGHGGHGGDGAGGCGGASVGIATSNATVDLVAPSWSSVPNAASGGAGGDGSGSTPIDNAPDGCDGLKGSQVDFSN